MEFFYIFTSFTHHVSILILVIYHFEVFSPLYMSVSNKIYVGDKKISFVFLHEDIKGLIEAYSEVDIIVIIIIIIIISIINNQLLYQNIV